MGLLEAELEDLRTVVSYGEDQQRLLEKMGWKTEKDAWSGGTDAVLNYYRARSAVHAGILSKILIEIIEGTGCPREISDIIRKGMR